ncbi:enoyl-CoA hydratase/isomerase family protein [Streptomyces sp. NPDC001255]|uniref:enoyl-CoA hydratase/isomerase family protein n=1 Tax=Streptomyces sp. NPDC001255 TaxID=3364550 RepID=UPI003697A3CA
MNQVQERGPGDVFGMVGFERLDETLAPLALDADGRPLNPVAFFDLTEQGVPTALESPARVREAAINSGRLLIGTVRGPVTASAAPLMEALDFTLLEGRPLVGVGPRTCVTVPDLELAAGELTRAVRRAPLAALTLRGLLRLTERLPVVEGLSAESAAYSALQSGPEFAAWRTSRPRRPVPRAAEPVLVQRDGGTLRIALNRPKRHNAFDAAIRDGLVEALEIARLDETVTSIELTGRGRSFCSGGDLDEFGTTSDPATAHILRLRRSAGAAVERCRERVHARLHGACVGAGIEVPAFAARVTARRGAFFQLPEVSMGLIPGAGGTVSVTRRIGRWRTAWLALTGQRVDAVTALGWGLVDELVDDF